MTGKVLSWCVVAALCFGLASRSLAVSGDARYRLWVHADAVQRDELSRAGYDIAGHALALDRVEIITDEEGYARLLERGFAVSLIEGLDAPRPLAQGSHGASAVDGPLVDTRYHDPAEVQAFLEGVHADHPAITRLEALGTTSGGRTIWGLMISDNASSDEDELSVLFSAAHHAREVMTPEVVMDTIDQLTDLYGIDSELSTYVDAYQIWCVPIVNPDGVARVHEIDDFWRKNTRDNDGDGSIDRQDGVDLNRNYEWGWGGQCQGSSSSFSSNIYRGPSEGSEAETQALIGLGRKIHPVFDVEYHSYGEDVFYALSCDPIYSPALSTIPSTDQTMGRVIAEAYAAHIVQADGGTGFHAAPFGSRVDGTGRDQQYHENGAIAFVTEVNNAAEGGFHPDYGRWRTATVEGQRAGWKWLLERMGGPAIGGHVRDAATGQPLEAELVIDEMALPDGRWLSSSSAKGRFHFIVVPGSYTLRVSAEGYASQVLALTVADAPFEELSIELEGLGGRIVVHEDFEGLGVATRWTAGLPGDSASDGQWVWGEPEGSFSGSIGSGLSFGNARLDRSAGGGHFAFVTGNQKAASFSSDDVDGGVTTLVSPAFDLSGLYGVRVSWQYWFRKEALDPLDRFEVEASLDGGTSWVPLDRIAETSATADASPAWVGRSLVLDEFLRPAADLRLRFRVFDEGAENVVEAALDEFRIRGYELATDGEIAGVRVAGATRTILRWDPVPGGDGAVYDVVRGELSSLSSRGGSGVELGALDCIEEDSSDTSSSGHPDEQKPPAGTGRYYLVRFSLGKSLGDWGRGSAGGGRHGSGGCTSD